MGLALVRQLVAIVGVEQSDITVGDTTCAIPNHYAEYCRREFTEVNFLAWADKWGLKGAVSSKGTEWETPLYWSTPDDRVYKQDYLPVSYAQADYLINFACLNGG